MESLLELLKKEQFDKVQKLIKEGMDLDQKDKYGFTALHIAVFWKNKFLVKKLLELGANPNVSSVDMIEHDIDVSDVPDSIPENNVSISLINELQSLGHITPLQIAINTNQEDIVALLLNCNADPNAKDLGGCTPLHWAANRGNERIIGLLLNHLAKVNVQDIAQSTSLHEASRKNFPSVVRILLSAGADPMIKDVTGVTPLDLMKERNNELYLHMLDFIKKAPDNASTH